MNKPSVIGSSSQVSGSSLFERYAIAANRRSRGRIDLQLRCLVRVGRLLWLEPATMPGISLARRWAAWRRGFRPLSAAAYGLDGDHWRTAELYVSDLVYAYRSYRMNGFWNPILTNKLIIAAVMRAHGLPHPPVLGVVAEGRLLQPGEEPQADATLLHRWTEEGQTVVFRPHWSGGGEGIFFLARQGNSWRINAKEAPASEVEALIGSLDRYIATAFVEQASYARRIQPFTANTLRVLTLTDEQGPFVASVVHRFGTSKTFPLDNFHGGLGLCAAVDQQRDALGVAVSLDRRGRRTLHQVHPETGSRIEGVPIPGLGLALQGVLQAARCIPEAIAVGWDVLITDDGWTLIEANAPPGIVVSQVHSPLLADARVARVFRRHGIGAAAAP